MPADDGPTNAVRQPVATMNFLGIILVMFCDSLGVYFTQPVLVPYGQFLGATLDEIALFVTFRYASAFLAMVWMPRCADRFGRKRVMMMAIFGNTVASLIQGLAAPLQANLEHPKAGVVIFIIGRCVAGFFGGTQPILQSTVAAMSMPDVQLMRTRLTILTASQMAFGVALAPISGAIAFFGLNVPWLVSTIVTFCVLVIFVFVYEDVAVAPKAAAAKGTDVKKRSPFRDPMLLGTMLSYTCVFICVSGSMMALPILLMQPSFGLVAGGREQTGKNIANAAGIVGLPAGMTNLLFSTAFFLAVSRRIGEIGTLAIGGIICAVCFCALGFMEKVWQVAVLQSFYGAGLGLLVPGLAPIISGYTSTFYPDRGSQAMAVPVMGLTMGMMFGPNIIGKLLGDRTLINVRLCYFFCGGVFLGGIILACTTLFAMKQIVARATKKEDSAFKLTDEEIAVMVQTQAVPPEPFVEEMCALLRGILTRGSPTYRNMPVWHGNAQKYLRRNLDQAFPQLPKFDEKTNGQEFFTDVVRWLFPIMTQEERVEILNTLPHVEVPDDWAHLFKTIPGRDAVPTWAAIDTNDFVGMIHRHDSSARRRENTDSAVSAGPNSEEGSVAAEGRPRGLSFGRDRGDSGAKYQNFENDVSPQVLGSGV